MRSGDAYYFQLLKKEIVAIMKRSYPGISDEISDWKGHEISNFQEDLALKVSEHISEKWFYTHMKSENDTLPRIDILNFLSRYAGYRDWDAFRHEKNNRKRKKTTVITPGRFFIILPMLTLVLLGLFYVLYKTYSTRDYQFCFFDAVTRTKIEDNIIEVSLLSDDESPKYYLCDRNGCLTITTGRSSITMVVKAPYYQTDTIVRILDKYKRDEQIMLHANNYALMIHYFSRMNINDWQKRRKQLDGMIAENALIYQVFMDGETGMELYSKWEFIDILTMPSGSLRNIEILDTKYMDDKISLLRFRQKREDL